MKLQITIEGKTYTADVEVLDEDASERLPGYPPYAAGSATAQPAPGSYTPPKPSDKHSADDKVYLSPVTGLVIRVNAVPGQQIKANDVILVLEAMKMETNVVARHAGKVQKLHVKEGDPVKLHQILIELD